MWRVEIILELGYLIKQNKTLIDIKFQCEQRGIGDD
jgi:hypothetical protein